MKKIAAISLYSGAGGLDAGFVRAGVDVEWAIDIDRDAVATYRSNIGQHIVCGDVGSFDPPDGVRPDLIIGGPPCQGFSVIGRMDPSDPRSRHVRHFLDVVERHGPAAFVMENVKSLAVSPRWGEIRDGLVERAEDLGYECRLLVLNAADFGVPQTRERMFLIGTRQMHLHEPVRTHTRKQMTVRDAFAQLPAFGDPGNDTDCPARIVPCRRPVMRPTPFKGTLLFNGSGRPLDLDSPAKTIPASMGGNATPIVDQRQLDTGSEPWVTEYHRHIAEGGKPYTQVPNFLRRITVEEAAALQSFPPDWKFSGFRGSQYRQIGNAVPPRLAEAVARAVVDAFESADSGVAHRELAAA